MSGQGKLLVKAVAWMRAIDDRIAQDRREPGAVRLIDVDARTSIQISRFLVDDDLSFFMSKRDLADRLGCAKSTAEASLERLEAAGFLRAVVPPVRLQSRRRGAGRSAKCFRIAKISPGQPGETGLRKTPDQSGEKEAISPGSPGEIQAIISPGRSGQVSPGRSGPIREEEKEALSRLRLDEVPAAGLGPDFDPDLGIDEGGHHARLSIGDHHG